MPEIILNILLILLLNGIAFYFVAMCIAGHIVYTIILKRKDQQQWSRFAPFEDLLQAEMHNRGTHWQAGFNSLKQDVHIQNAGLNLYGEYYDLGNKKAVIVLSGRTESLRYGYFFAKPYVESGYNVLVIDARAHGESDGTFNTVGFEESKDALAWAQYLHEQHGVASVVFHGICIGAAGGLYGITSSDCPDYIHGLVAEGMFSTFGASVKQHVIEMKKNFPFLTLFINMWMKIYTGHSMYHGPIHEISKMSKPLLMLHSREDFYSLPHLAQKLYDTCRSPSKKLVWFPNGRHSMLRITHTEMYDNAIKEFLQENNL